MRLSQFTTEDGTKNWGIDTSTVPNFDHLLAAYGDYVYCQGTLEESIQKRARVDGALVWQKDFPIGVPVGTFYPRIMVDGLGNIYTTKTGTINKYDSNGDFLWTHDLDPVDKVHLLDVMHDGSKVLIATYTDKVYILNSAGEIALDLDVEVDGEKGGALDSDGNFIVTVTTVRKYNGVTGAQIWTTVPTPLSHHCVDPSSNYWVASTTRVIKLGKNTGNWLLDLNIFTNIVKILPISNGNIAVIMYDDGTDVLTIDIRDSNGIQLIEKTHSGITEYNDAVITV